MIEPKLNPEIIHNETDLLAAAIHIDRYMMDAMDRLDEDFAEINSLTMQTFRQLSRNKHELNDKVLSGRQTPGEDVTHNLEQITLYNKQMEAQVDTPTSRLQRLCACCDRSCDFYSAIAEISGDEAVTRMAQQLAGSARERINILRAALGGQCGCECSEC
jgi:hypothetical protein